MSQHANKIARSRMRSVVTLLLSVVLAMLSVGVAAPLQLAQAAPLETRPQSLLSSAYTCLWYRVRSGDTLNKLAARYGVTVLTLRRVNGLKTTRIFTGQQLCIPREKPAPRPPAPPQPPAGPWYGEYWNNTIQSGPPALVRNDAAINFNWGYGSPDLQRVQPDYFSARWTRNIRFTEGVWRFGVIVDDGVRITVDNQVVMDFFNNVGPIQRTVDIPLTGGEHRITVDYVEQTGLAYIQFNTARLSPLPPAPPLPPQPPFPPDNAKFNNGPWYTEIFANPNFAGPPSFVSTVCCLRFDWRGGSPAPGVPGTFFTARFSQVRYFPAGVYQFVARVDDGIRIYLDNQLIMNEFREQSTRTFTANANLGAGNHSIVIEYVQYGGTSDLSMYWDFLGDPNAPRVVPLAPIYGPIPYYPPLP